ncbi:Csu type fimbrial protein [Sinorhizobium arboris]|uniref:Csu type fimbrial protein n=1 Tax=Sinorhizobium arboris TaxID=76745 RepID=UPI00041C4AF7|nr:spore coat U domain-containing protein [Sinorhizobium arboris]
MLRFLSTGFVFVLLAPAAALAQSCSFGVTNVNFGTVDTLAGNAIDSTATVTVTCNGGVTGARFNVCLNINAGSGGATSGVRQMRSASNAALNYSFYQNAARTTPWGAVDQLSLGNPVQLTLTATPLGSAQATRTIYARVLPGQQTTPSGTYTSTFSGTATGTRFNWRTYSVNPQPCSNVTQNPVSPTFSTQAIIASNCRVTAQRLYFGNYGVLNTNIDAAGNLGVTCTQGTAYSVGLSNGLSGTGPTNRRMTLGDRAVTYGLYKDAARSQPWGNSGAQAVTGTGAGVTQNLPVYGRVPPQPTPPTGTYSDTVVVTVTY